MRNDYSLFYKNNIESQKENSKLSNSLANEMESGSRFAFKRNDIALPEILFLTSYPPRECGIATYSQDLVHALKTQFTDSFSVKICALESENEKHIYPEEVCYRLNTSALAEYSELADVINYDNEIKIVLVQHEFGFFHQQEKAFLQFLYALRKPVIMVFHTVLPNPSESMKSNVKGIINASKFIITMTHNSADILFEEYGVQRKMINVIPHGTHLVTHLEKTILKEKYNVTGRKVLSTFGLLSSGKGIEISLKALTSIVKKNENVLFLIIGKTHPSVVKHEGEKYRKMLEEKVAEFGLQNHVRFINKYVPLPELLEYLQLTDIYLFTSKDPNQAVSGTFSYAMSCGCPIISTPIPHACEVLKDDTGIIIYFDNPVQLSDAVNNLLSDDQLRLNTGLNGLHKIASTAWENSSIQHALLFEKTGNGKIKLKFKIPVINLQHLKKLTTDFGIIQFARINQPDLESGYTLDDNARALIAVCNHYELTRDENDIAYINTYLQFIKFCMQQEGYFLNYVDDEKKFTAQNNSTNLADAHGRAIWALGYLVSKKDIIPESFTETAKGIIEKSLHSMFAIYSTRAMCFAIKGLCYLNSKLNLPKIKEHIIMLTNRLVQMYRHEAEENWQWYESYLTYANSLLPEAMLYAYTETGDEVYKEISKATFDFLLAQTFVNNKIKVISNRSWLHKGQEAMNFGEQPIDVAYTILTLGKFYDVFGDAFYLEKMETAFNWFLGSNHLNRIIYNPCTGGCYDGLEENHVNLNQGAESTISYLLARLAMEKYFNKHEEDSMNKEEKEIIITYFPSTWKSSSVHYLNHKL